MYGVIQITERKKRGKYIVVEGIDACGKGLIIDTFKEIEAAKGKRICDLRELWHGIPQEGNMLVERFGTTNVIPEYSMIHDFDTYIVAEPTYGDIGKVIREEIIRTNEREYSALTTAHLYSADREILLKKLVLDALKDGKNVLSERNLTSSLVYQSVQSEGELDFDTLAALPGNRFAYENAPFAIVIAKVSAASSMKRLAIRKKQDKCNFEKEKFLEKLVGIYEGEKIRRFWERAGTKVIYVDETGTREDTIAVAYRLYDQLVI